MRTNRFAATFILLALTLATAEWPCPAASSASGDGETPRNLLAENPRLKELIAAANRASGPEEIVRLADAGADPSLIQTYVEFSGRRYDLDADQIIELHKRGVSSGVIASMIRSKPNAETQPVAPPPVQPIIIKSEVQETPPASTVTYIGNSPRPYRYAYPLPYRSAYSYASCGAAYYGGYNYCGYGPSYCYRPGYSNYRPAWASDYCFRGCW